MTEPTVLPIHALLQDPENANEGTERGRALIRASLESHGYLESATIDADNSLVGGNKRIAEAASLGYDEVLIVEPGPRQVVAIRRPDLDLDSDDPDVRARSRQAAYALNWSAVQSIKLNPIRIADDLASGIDLSRLFTRKDLVRLGVQLDAPDPDLDDSTESPPASQAQQRYQVVPGDIFQLGRHVLACGDCTDASLLSRILPAVPDLLVTSPPYAVGKAYEQDDDTPLSGAELLDNWRTLIQDAFGRFRDIGINLIAVNLADRHTGNDGWEAHTYGELVSMLASLGYSHLNTRVWVKQPAWSQTPYWHNTYKTVDEFEYIGVFAHTKPEHVQRLTNDENNEWGFRSVWTINSVRQNDIHSAMFPIDLPIRLIRIHTDRDALIFDPFVGSGTTIIAAEAMRRTCIGIEIEPESCAAALQRYHEITKIQPERVSAPAL